MWITTKCGKFWKRRAYQTTLPVSWEICIQVKKQQLEPDMEQWTGSKLGEEYIKAVYYHPTYLTYMQSISCEMMGWMTHKLESRLPGEISITSDMQMTPPDGRRWRGTEEPFDGSERGKWKSLLKTQLSKNKEHGIQSHHFLAMGKQWKEWQTLFSWAPKSLQMVTTPMKLTDACSFEEKLWPI